MYEAKGTTVEVDRLRPLVTANSPEASVSAQEGDRLDGDPQPTR